MCLLAFAALPLLLAIAKRECVLPLCLSPDCVNPQSLQQVLCYRTRVCCIAGEHLVGHQSTTEFIVLSAAFTSYRVSLSAALLDFLTHPWPTKRCCECRLLRADEPQTALTMSPNRADMPEIKVWLWSMPAKCSMVR